MLNANVHTLMITSRCSAGCRPCPFGQGTLPQRYLGAAEVIAVVNKSTAELVVITGGEPLEHPDFASIVRGLNGAIVAQSTQPEESGGAVSPGKTPFRIATGGHVPLGEFPALLQRSPRFQGFSVGTDVLTDATPHREALTRIWQHNIQLLNAQNTRYSLTLTLHSSSAHADESMASGALAEKNTAPPQDALSPLRTAANLGAQPEFIYLRHRENPENAAHLHKEIAKIFENAPLLCESL